MKANRAGARVDQIGFRFLVQVVWLGVTVWLLVCLALVG